MTNQPTNQERRSQHREDCKVQKLIERIEAKLALQPKATIKANRTPSKN